MLRNRRTGSSARRSDRRANNDSLARSLWPLVLAWLAALSLWIVVLVQDVVPVDQLLLDKASDGAIPWYTGFVSSLGILLWVMTVCACSATAFVAYHGSRTAATKAFRGAAIFFGVLLLDDLFLLHSDVIPRLIPLSKHAIISIEAGLGMLWLVPAWSEIRRTRWEILASAGVGFGTSILVDILLEEAGSSTLVLVLEDGAKFLGGVALATWAIVTAADVIRSVTKSSQQVSEAALASPTGSARETGPVRQTVPPSR